MWAGVTKACSWCFVAVLGTRLWGWVWEKRNRVGRVGRRGEGGGEREREVCPENILKQLFSCTVALHRKIL